MISNLSCAAAEDEKDAIAYSKSPTKPFGDFRT
jgi:hypothetical protein